MLYDIIRVFVIGVIALVLIGAILSSVLHINIGSEIANYGLKYTIERIWNGPQR